jgi:putative tricarboxylic transport membrane protein
MEVLAAGWDLAFTWDNLLLGAAGLIIGIVIGAIPGLNVPLAVALALPFTFALPPLAGLAMLIGIYKGGTYGGSISAILINVPGTPAAAAAALDGYPMARQGKPGKALKTSLYSSVIGELISDLALIALAIPIAVVALAFGPAEYFAIAVFALTIIGLVSGPSLLRGLIAAAVGVLLALVGLDPLIGQPRLAFGVPQLSGGIAFIALIIGMFAISEILIQAEKSLTDAAGRRVLEVSPDATADRLTREDIRRCLPAILRSTPIGIFIGAIPGLGSAIAAYVAYGVSQRFSREPERFGKGAIEGVASCESANNAVCSSTMVPLLTLGVPGDVITAIMLGALTVHGIIPGPALFQNQADLVTAFFILMLLVSVMHLGIGRAGLSLFIQAVRLPHAVLFPVVAVICVTGTYVSTGSFFNVYIMLALGVLGYLMVKNGFPIAPLLIGFILSPLIEVKLRQALLISRGDPTIFLTRPISAVFLALTLIVILTIAWQTLAAHRNRRAGQGS